MRHELKANMSAHEWLICIKAQKLMKQGENAKNVSSYFVNSLLKLMFSRLVSRFITKDVFVPLGIYMISGYRLTCQRHGID